MVWIVKATACFSWYDFTIESQTDITTDTKANRREEKQE